MRMTVSEVWKGTPHSAMAGGTIGRPPAAITIRSAESASVPVPSHRSTSNARGPVNRAWPS